MQFTFFPKKGKEKRTSKSFLWKDKEAPSKPGII